MELSYFLAQLFGLTMIIFAFIWWARPQLVDQMPSALRQQPFSMLLAGFLGIVGGLAIIISHNIWEFSWVGLVTLFGWAALVKGVAYIAFSDLLLSTAEGALTGKRRPFMIAFALLVGLYLAYNGFGLGL